MKQHLLTFFKSFLKCGLIGWCMEIIYTSLLALRSRDLTLKGSTSLWMFPIYGCAVFLTPLIRLIKNLPAWKRGLTYASMIFSAEYLSGKLLSKRNLCPWDYSKSRWNIGRVIRLDYAPYWFGAGLLFERFLSSPKKKNSTV